MKLIITNSTLDDIERIMEEVWGELEEAADTDPRWELYNELEAHLVMIDEGQPVRMMPDSPVLFLTRSCGFHGAQVEKRVYRQDRKGRCE